MFQVLLHRLQESVSEQTEVDQRVPAEQDGLDSLHVEGVGADGWQPQSGLDEAAIREYFSAKNLKNVRNDSSRRSSGCFGRRMDRIGSMSSLGCNTVGRSKYSNSTSISRAPGLTGLTFVGHEDNDKLFTTCSP